MKEKSGKPSRWGWLSHLSFQLLTIFAGLCLVPSGGVFLATTNGLRGSLIGLILLAAGVVICVLYAFSARTTKPATQNENVSFASVRALGKTLTPKHWIGISVIVLVGLALCIPLGEVVATVVTLAALIGVILLAGLSIKWLDSWMKASWATIAVFVCLAGLVRGFTQHSTRNNLPSYRMSRDERLSIAEWNQTIVRARKEIAEEKMVRHRAAGTLRFWNTVAVPAFEYEFEDADFKAGSFQDQIDWQREQISQLAESLARTRDGSTDAELAQLITDHLGAHEQFFEHIEIEAGKLFKNGNPVAKNKSQIEAGVAMLDRMCNDYLDDPDRVPQEFHGLVVLMLQDLVESQKRFEAMLQMQSTLNARYPDTSFRLPKFSPPLEGYSEEDR